MKDADEGKPILRLISKTNSRLQENESAYVRTKYSHCSVMKK